MLDYFPELFQLTLETSMLFPGQELSQWMVYNRLSSVLTAR